MYFIKIIIFYVFLVSPVFTCIMQNTKWTLNHALLYSFIVFKYVILILLKENYIQGEMAYILGGLGRSWDMKSKGKIVSGSLGIFQGFGKINALFLGSKGAKTPLWGLRLIKHFRYSNEQSYWVPTASNFDNFNYFFTDKV